MSDKKAMIYDEYNYNIIIIRIVYFFIVYILISKLLLAEKMES